ncbi:MAG TPA: DNA polymerase/3'-5' exonuclease PolX [Burkholderiaceae bacterium]|jgi:DNA polymerase (family 10)|nr:DNA polymerase/3'-5' exonuclease PolX [Burkholderiaceae bacterium]
MALTNADIAAAFEEIADLLELQDANPFRVRAYRNAARILGELKLDLAADLQAGKPLPKLPGIGADLAGKIEELVRTGRLAALEKLRRQVPAGVTELLRLPGLGPKRVRALYERLHVHTPEQLLRAARDGRIRDLPGFGAKSEARIAEAVAARLASGKRFKLAVAAQYAARLIDHLRRAPAVSKIVAAGSLRRAKETVGDIDLLATAADGAPVVQHFTRHSDAAQVLAAGDTRASIVLKNGLQVDLRVVPPPSYGAALLYFTGSKAHNIRLRNLALAHGCKLNEYGLFKGRRAIAAATEEEIYAALGLPWIPPELREDRGEIEAAKRNALPRLVELADLAGDFHVHTKWSDGTATIEDMARAARERGLRYIAISEHSRRLTVAHGLDPVRLAQQADEIAQVNARLDGIAVLAGIEVDVLEDGTLDLPDSALAKLDLVIAAVHSKFNLPRARQTARVLAALDNPYVKILAHPLGRLIDRRDPYDIDMLAVIRKCRARGVALEVNAHPDRLDLTDTYCRMAKDEGARVAIDSDAHAPHEFDNLVHGVGQARRGWLERSDVLNTRSLDELLAWLDAGKEAP